MDKLAKIFAVVRKIPRGKVATYGQVAALAGLPRRARLVGHALQACDEKIPWQRVINAAGRVSPRGEPMFENQQRIMLEDEGVKFTKSGRIDLVRFGWRPKSGKLSS